MTTAAPTFLYKVISQKDWEESLEKKKLILSPMDAHFVHLATEKQVAHVTTKFWKDQAYVLLKVSVSELTGELKYETNPGGSTCYYHLYNGEIPLRAVEESIFYNEEHQKLL